MANQIEHYRKRRNLTREALAAATGTTAQQIYRLERGKVGLKMHWAQKLAQALDVSVDSLVGTAANDSAEPTANQTEPVRSDLPSDIDFGAVARTVLPGVETSDTYTMDGDALTGKGILDGDHLIIDTKAAPRRGDVVILEVYANARYPQRIARVYDPPFLLSHSISSEPARPILIDNAQVKILGVVQAVMRLK